jgi:hypothetical protein
MSRDPVVMPRAAGGGVVCLVAVPAGLPHGAGPDRRGPVVASGVGTAPLQGLRRETAPRRREITPEPSP